MSDIITIHALAHTYLPGTPMATMALTEASLHVKQGSITALVGASGSGKSTLAHFVNGLLRPTAPGQVSVLGQDTAAPACDLTALRRRVALVFQNPEHQLLERYVGDDVAYGPRQIGLSGDELRARVRWALEVVGLDMDLFVDRLTFSLSGGETRRVALAGALALHPEILVLDEATTGLDPRGKAEVHALLRRICQDEGLTVLVISNDMDEVAALADAVTVLHAGRTVWAGATRAALAADLPIEAWGLAPPTATHIAAQLASQGLCARRDVLSAAEAEEAIWQAMTR